MMKRIGALALMLIVALTFGASARAEGEDLGDKLKNVGEAIGDFAQAFGQAAGDAISDWGDQLKAFSEDPDAYIDQNEFLRGVRDKANELGQSLREYWPTLKEALVGAANTVVDSDMSWDDKKEALKQYAQLAIPYLKEAEFEGAREEAVGAMDLGAEFIESTLDSDASWADKREMLSFYEEAIGPHVTELLARENDEKLASAYDALKAVCGAADEAQAKANLIQLRRQIEALK